MTEYVCFFPQVFPCELEKVGKYSDFNDFCNTFQLSRGKNIEEEESNIVGEYKVQKMYHDVNL